MNKRIRHVVAGIALALTAGLLGSPAASAENPSSSAAPNFQLPFPCGQTWSLTTYRGHSPDDKKVDFFRVGGVTNGSAVVAAAAGVVNEVHPGVGGVEINHGGGYFTLYLHMSGRNVNVGTRVAAGQRIGTVGRVATGVPHLHYELLYDFNGNNNGENGEWVRPIFNGVTYQLIPGRPFSLVSRNRC
ncbi:M23 family metallopeptidase [Allokutzneria sp. A3M-2-11 16]|uniref:M23 family metallopeptidase n=1 Tax=Allokutzneria sp. A3M-2-11 16 TaxID=2962043 RepID=UPI0020B81D86|nr:M23 family metallopeptidase [Allokutzneria sp. A3M-2-11 16]MCP3800913.1 M23 family metallopeptidase [Allokutzneria sp. A3M-2-11 16]